MVGVPHSILAAISLGAVFMGANTYIGNGPNFMVRSIAEERGVRMPSFGGYMLYSGAVLAPRVRAGHAGVLPAMSAGWAAFAAVLGANALLMGFLALRVWRQSHVPGRRAFAATLVALAIWAGGYAGETLATSLEDKSAWLRLENFGIATLVPLFFLFALRYTGGSAGATRRAAGVVFVVPVLTLLILFSGRVRRPPLRQPQRRSRTPGGRWSCPAGPGTTCRRCTRTS